MIYVKGGLGRTRWKYLDISHRNRIEHYTNEPRQGVEKNQNRSRVYEHQALAHFRGGWKMGAIVNSPIWDSYYSLHLYNFGARDQNGEIARNLQNTGLPDTAKQTRTSQD